MPRVKPNGIQLTILVVILAAGLALRVMWLYRVDTQPVTDFAWYFQKAIQIARGEGYHHEGLTTAYWPVGWPAALGLSMKVFGEGLGQAKAFSLFLTWLAIPLTYLLGLKLFHKGAPALAGAGIIALHPHFVAYSSILASEPLFTCLTLAFFIFQSDSVKKPVSAGLSGIALGLACLVRPQALLLPLLVRIFSWRQDSPRRPQAWAAWGLCMILALGVLSPWLLHAKAAFGRFVFVSTNGGDNLLIGHHPGATGRYKSPDDCGLLRPPAMTESERDQAALKQGIANIASDPLLSLNLIPAKLKETLFTTTDAAYWAFQTNPVRLEPAGIKDPDFYKWFRGVSQWTQWILLGLALLGLLRLIASTRTSSLPILVAGLFLPLLLSVVFFGNPRFFFGAIPLCALLAGALIALPAKEAEGQSESTDQEAV